MKVYTPVIAKAHTPPYKIHRYFARRPWNVFKQLVKVFSDEKDVVLDPFCGGGVTIYESIRLGRKAVGFDLNPLAIFLVRNMVKKNVNLTELDSTYLEILSYLKYIYSDYNLVDCELNQQTSKEEKIEISWNELAFYVFCNYCNSTFLLSNENKLANGRYSCPNLNCKGNKNNGGFVEPKNCRRNGYDYLFSVAYSPVNKKKIFIDYNADRRNDIKKHIRFLQSKIKKNKIEISKDAIPINWDRQYEDLLFQKGIKTFQDLFTKRNLLINLLLLDYISKLHVSKDIIEILRLVFSSSLRDTNIMSFTNRGWQSGKPTTWSKHAYWIPSQFCEVNVLHAFGRAFNRVRSALIFNEQFDYRVSRVSKFSDLKEKGDFLLINSSIDESNIPSNSVDVIITDPPYGSNVQYLELSHFWYVWNKDLYGKKVPNFYKEAVANRKRNFVGAKTMVDYEDKLFSVFKESYRVLKPNHYMVLTFNNKNVGAWLALLISIFRSDFVLEQNGLYFQDGVDNYKQTAHTKNDGSPYGDFIYVFKKNPNKRFDSKPTGIKSDFIQDLDKTFSKYLDALHKLKSDRNTVLKDMFWGVIPKIEAYVKTNPPKNNRNDLYKHFNKNYLKKLYH